MSEGAAHLVERDAQLSALDAHLAAVGDDGQGRLLFVGGEAGAGKTSLVAAFTAARAPAAVRGYAEPLAAPRPLGALVDVAVQLGGRIDTAVAEGASAVELVSTLAADLPRDPVPVLVLEDLHWADEATLDVLRVLGRRLDRVKALVVGTYRDDQIGPAHALRTVLGELAPQPLVHRITVPPLTPRGVAELVDDRLDAGDLHRLTRGNPFFVTEVLAGDGEVPDTVRDAVLARRARLVDVPRGVLDAFSIVPGRVEPWLAEALAGASLEGLDACLASGVLVLEGDAVQFRHEIARVVVEESLSPFRRVDLHRRALAAMEAHSEGDPARMAHHAARAGDPAALLRHAVRAGRQAASLRAHREAADQYALALESGAPMVDDVRADLLDRHAYECYLTDRIAEAAVSRRQLLDLHRRAGDRLREGDTHR